MYQILIIPILAGMFAQVCKFFTKSNDLKFSFKNFTAYSGMPSAHSAIVISLLTIVGLKEGIKSPIFALSAVFALLVIRDAIGLRRYLGQHGKILNILVKDLKDDKFLDEQYPLLLERIGHTPLQVVIGSIIGLIFSLVGYFLLN